MAGILAVNANQGLDNLKACVVTQSLSKGVGSIKTRN